MVVSDFDSGVRDQKGKPLPTKLELERKDFFKVGGFVLALVGLILGAVVPLSMFVFQTRTEAVQDKLLQAKEHAAIWQATALREQEAKIRREQNDKETAKTKADIADLKQMVNTVHTNQRIFMNDMGVRARPMPASIKVEKVPGR